MFLLLFWSIIFQSVPGAFETPFQRGPLDLGFDSFLYARTIEIEQRLKEIESGEGPRIVAEVDDRERPTRTFGVGAKWDAFTKEDVIEATEVWLIPTSPHHISSMTPQVHRRSCAFCHLPRYLRRL